MTMLMMMGAHGHHLFMNYESDAESTRPFPSRLSMNHSYSDSKNSIPIRISSPVLELVVCGLEVQLIELIMNGR